MFLFIYVKLKDISSNKLGAHGCMSMCDMLQNNVSLLKIDLSDNGFSDKDTVSLLDAFKVSWKLFNHVSKRNKCKTCQKHSNSRAFFSPVIEPSVLIQSLFLSQGNDKVAWMNLSHNKFSERSGENLGLGISMNHSYAAIPYLLFSNNFLR